MKISFRARSSASAFIVAASKWTRTQIGFGNRAPLSPQISISRIQQACLYAIPRGSCMRVVATSTLPAHHPFTTHAARRHCPSVSSESFRRIRERRCWHSRGIFLPHSRGATSCSLRIHSICGDGRRFDAKTPVRVRRKVEMRKRAQMRRDDRRCSRRRIPTTVRGCTRSKGAQNRTPQIPLIGLAMLAQDKRSGCEGVADFLCDVHGLVDDRFIFVLGWATRAASLDRTRRCWRSMSLFRV